MQKHISIHNARLHNLKNIDVQIPKNQLVAFTGVSGSGKSSLAFDLIYEEGRRRYLQSIGLWTDLVEETGFDRISGLGPTVAVQQGVIRQSNPRSMVGTRSGVFTPLRLLFVYEGERDCPECGAPGRAARDCAQCGRPAEPLNSGYFSGNSTLGMCLTCQGRGTLFELDLERLIPDRERTTLRQILSNAGCLISFNSLINNYFKAHADTPVAQVPEAVTRQLLYGVPVGEGRLSRNLFEHLKWRYLKGREVNGCIRRAPCPDCQGARVSAETRQVRLAGRHIGQWSALTLDQAAHDLEAFADGAELAPLSRNLIADICQRLNTLRQHGLGHLTLQRETPSLSGGELQRLFLASHIDAQMDSLIYVLDEPTVGLHEREKEALLEQLRRLKEQGNSVLLVEHDRRMIAAADAVIDIGPLAGRAGGQLIYQGDYAGLLACPESRTGRYLSGAEALPPRAAPRALSPDGPRLRLVEVSTNNLQSVSVSLPLGGMVGVAGVSGSGKSSLVMKTLVPLLDRAFARDGAPAAPAEEEEGDDPAPVWFSGRLEGIEALRGFSAVAQQPIGRNDHSNPATYLKLWDPIRKLFAAAPEARERGLTAGDFSFNARGACPACSGNGKQRLWLGGAFFASQPCPACQGKRFRPEVLEARLRGKTVLDVLEMPVSEALTFFAGQPALERILTVLERSGMGYLPLGQPAPTLSGGEAQRLKLAVEISRARNGGLLYVLDEPTIGLSLYDTGRLLQLLDELILKGNSIVLIEHDPAVLSRCDWLIELGPGCGPEGGRVIAEGTPARVRANPASVIGPYLEDV